MSLESDQPDPTRLADALRAAYTHRKPIPPAVESSILSAAHESFTARRRCRMTLRWATGLAASLAAAIAIAAILHRPATPPATPLAKATLNGDLNADGHVDMLDALLLAKHVAAHDVLDKNWDTNADGVVDEKDIDTVAATAVRLTPPTAFLPRPVLRERAGVRASLANQTAPASLPTFDDLKLSRLHVGCALADVSSRATFAKATPTKHPNPEAPQ